MTWRMPAEGAPHECTWMAWPTGGYAGGAEQTWAEVAHAIAEFEPVKMVVDPSATAAAGRLLGSEVELFVAPLDDAWMRDIGPTFVISQTGELGAVDWVFNGWGAQSWATWDRDAQIGRRVAQWAGATVIGSEMVNEGGAIHVDGAGTVLVTETVQRGEGRNSHWTRAQVEAELGRTLGVDRVVWVERGLTRDYDQFGTRGHIDIVATMPSPGVVLLHHQTDPAHPDFEVSATVRSGLEKDLPGWEIRHLPAPHRLTDEHGPVDWSYVNHLVVNGGVVACTFDDPRDADAAAILRDAYPGRRVVGVDARPLFDRGGGIHCITQHQPAT
ncbi:MAG: agmatine deiminase family protein [Nocardioides sp.]